MLQKMTISKTITVTKDDRKLHTPEADQFIASIKSEGIFLLNRTVFPMGCFPRSHRPKNIYPKLAKTVFSVIFYVFCFSWVLYYFLFGFTYIFKCFWSPTTQGTRRRPIPPPFLVREFSALTRLKNYSRQSRRPPRSELPFRPGGLGLLRALM